MPSSRSSSSMGMPGGYGVSVRIHSGTSNRRSMSMRILTRAAGSGRVRAEYFGTESAPCNRRQSALDARFEPMAAQVEEEVVLPGPLPQRPRLDLDQVDPMLCERTEELREHADLVAHGHDERGLVV